MSKIPLSLIKPILVDGAAIQNDGNDKGATAPFASVAESITIGSIATTSFVELHGHTTFFPAGTYHYCWNAEFSGGVGLYTRVYVDDAVASPQYPDGNQFQISNSKDYGIGLQGAITFTTSATRKLSMYARCTSVSSISFVGAFFRIFRVA